MIGIDLVEIERICELYSKHKDRFVNRILAEEELEQFSEKQDKERFLAKSWAVKEAYYKAKGTGILKQSDFKAVWVTHDAYGRPILNTKDGTMGHVSITDTDHYAQAVVMLTSS